MGLTYRPYTGGKDNRMKTFRIDYRCGYIQSLFVEATADEVRDIACDELGINEDQIVGIEEVK